MPVVDVYFEWLLTKHGPDGSALPFGETEKRFLQYHNILIMELYTQLTIYSETDYRTGKALLMLLKKFCFSKRTYSNAPLSASFSEYSDATLQMIEEELARLDSVSGGLLPTVDPEKVFTIIANAMQLMTSVALHHQQSREEKTQKTKAKVAGLQLPIYVDAQKEIIWERNDTAIIDIIPYLDEAFAINESFEKTRSNGNTPSKVIGEWAEFKYLSLILQLSKKKLDEVGVF